jgi:hypothetical protein
MQKMFNNGKCRLVMVLAVLAVFASFLVGCNFDEAKLNAALAAVIKGKMESMGFDLSQFPELEDVAPEDIKAIISAYSTSGEAGVWDLIGKSNVLSGKIPQLPKSSQSSASYAQKAILFAEKIGPTGLVEFAGDWEIDYGGKEIKDTDKIKLVIDVERRSGNAEAVPLGNHTLPIEISGKSIKDAAATGGYELSAAEQSEVKPSEPVPVVPASSVKIKLGSAKLNTAPSMALAGKYVNIEIYAGTGESRTLVYGPATISGLPSMSVTWGSVVVSDADPTTMLLPLVLPEFTMPRTVGQTNFVIRIGASSSFNVNNLFQYDGGFQPDDGVNVNIPETGNVDLSSSSGATPSGAVPNIILNIDELNASLNPGSGGGGSYGSGAAN